MDEARYGVLHCRNNRRRGKTYRKGDLGSPFGRAVTAGDLRGPCGVPHCRNNGHRGKTVQRNRRERPMYRSGNDAIITHAVERNHPPTCHSEGAQRVEESTQVASFILWWFFLQRGGFLHSAGAAVGMTKWGNVSGIIGNSSVLSGAERHTGRSLRFRWLVDSFIRTGYIRNVAGGRLPPLRSRWGVVPFNHTGSSRYVSGTAHRPFPTVSLIG